MFGVGMFDDSDGLFFRAETKKKYRFNWLSKGKKKTKKKKKRR